MIAYELEYLRPEMVEEAAAAFVAARDAGRNPCYLGGGTEVVTMARDGKVHADTLIELARLPDCRVLDRHEDETRFGAALTLNEVIEDGDCPLLSTVARAVADHTVRNSVTLGGNILGLLPYREAVLPFLLFDGRVEIAGPTGRRWELFPPLFDKRVRLKDGEFAIAFSLPRAARNAAYFYRRRERDSRVDYPLVALAMTRLQRELRFAVSGAFGYPLRRPAAERALTEFGPVRARAGAGASADTRYASAVSAALEALPQRYHADMRASAQYRRALLAHALEDGLRELSGAGVQDDA